MLVRTDDDFDIVANSTDISSVSDDLFPSGPWIGFYIYSGDRDRHRMDLALDFGNGIVTGEGSDDIGAFVIRGRYDAKSKECHWTKTYVGRHDVFYKGFREGRGIWGTWEYRNLSTGGFKIWPLASGADDDDAETEEKGEPVEAVGEVAGAGAPETFRGRRAKMLGGRQLFRNKPEVTKLLFGAPRRDVCFVRLFQQLKPLAEFSTKGSSIVASHIEPAAFQRTINGECGDDDLAIPCKRSLQSVHVFLAFGFVGQKVEDGPIMPDAEAVRWVELGDIGHEPGDLTDSHSQPRLGVFERCRRNVQHGQPFEAGVQQEIHEQRRAASNVNESLEEGPVMNRRKENNYPAKLGIC